MVAIHHELNMLAGPDPCNWISHVRRRSSQSSSQIEEEQGFNEAEVSYVKQGEEALQKSISILSNQDGWTTEITAVSIEIAYAKTAGTLTPFFTFSL
ncbi:steroidogenic acute regulatory protein, mitochondrial-like [Salvelinus sp. IW2-2015]|uniref:steroidogenic acute regulatory protein, mitochondrial-like n=1 Tax=Salvelinus sp. IW2-2015 TaxID=2691554 RepID=UPI0038D4A437